MDFDISEVTDMDEVENDRPQICDAMAQFLNHRNRHRGFIPVPFGWQLDSDFTESI